ncbi:hypothetical protein NLU13_2978 [Sarocladium strictum]|uniref:Gcp-like domain-containing protein n=1 Tax=Sarocladium strictum TaxID=5046 RepID=A0AA39L9V6_SARSR|nr:hypothetical protein NLU13_2978 [Sarocladium strictum]
MSSTPPARWSHIRLALKRAYGPSQRPRRRCLTTLAIESSCDDTAVAVLTRRPSCPSSRSHHGSSQLLHPSEDSTLASLLFNQRISSDNRAFKGVHPAVAVVGHATSLAKLVRRAINHLPKPASNQQLTRKLCYADDGSPRLVPDFVSVTRGPGMTTNLAIGMDTAKGLSVAWGVPFIGVHHMQAHALTPQLVSALNMPPFALPPRPHFPFLSLLVSGGHTQLVLSTNLTTHRILATTLDSAIGNVLDQTARLILPASEIASSPDVMYGRLLESFAFPPEDPDPYGFFKPYASRGEEMVAKPTGYGWTIPLPFRQSREVAFSFSSIYSTVHRITTSNRSMPLAERRALARHTLASAFQHLIGRICLAIEADPATLLPALRNSLVVAGGVASNKFLMHVLRETLKVRVPQLEGKLEVVSPPVELCTDNAAMIAWAGMEMFENGWHTDLGATPVPKWPMDPAHGSGLLGVDGWLRREGSDQAAQ